MIIPLFQMPILVTWGFCHRRGDIPKMLGLQRKILLKKIDDHCKPTMIK